MEVFTHKKRDIHAPHISIQRHPAPPVTSSQTALISDPNTRKNRAQPRLFAL